MRINQRNLVDEFGLIDPSIDRSPPHAVTNPMNQNYCCCYVAGPIAAAEAHFEAIGHPMPAGINIADWVLDLVIRSPPAEVCTVPLAAAYRSVRIYTNGHKRRERI